MRVPSGSTLRSCAGTVALVVITVIGILTLIALLSGVQR